MKVLANIVFMYRPAFESTIVYMLQSTEYHVMNYVRWLWRTQDFTSVMYRRQLDTTRRARLLLMLLVSIVYAMIGGGVYAVSLGYLHDDNAWILLGAAAVIAAPLAGAHLILLPLVLARWAVVIPKNRAAVRRARQTFAEFTGIKIAVAGSYGKTTMKEILNTVLSEGKVVAATPGNKNVAVAHAWFADSLNGNEDILIIEYGEGKPGDIARFARATVPTHAIVTGIAPAHLDAYKTLDAVVNDIYSVGQFVDGDHMYVNGESTESRYRGPSNVYDRSGALGWKVSDVKLSTDGMTFAMQRGSHKLHLQTRLLGEHLLGPLALVVALAHEFGLSDKQIVAGVANTKPHEHRMQPYALGGGWVIDDSYNGNIEGVRAGTELLKTLPAKRKVYVTPGLVDQGSETERVHGEMGRLIAAAEPDEAVLMHNSVTEHIVAGLNAAEFAGKLTICEEPLAYYQNMEHLIAKGDIYMLQNDWTDNYR